MTEETRMIMEQLQKMNGRLDGIDSRLDGIDNRLDKVEGRLDRVESEATQTRLILEGEVRRSIMIIAECYQGLSRKFDELLTNIAEREMIKLRLTALESDMKILKDRAGISLA